MCLGVPMRVVERNGAEARCEAKGISRTVSLLLLEHESVEPGDHVLVHVGYAIQKISQADADGAWDIFERVLAEQDRAPDDA
jgi:hydrogenase expression/formation protein HypC